jgi:hypothetical protein
MRYPFFWDVMQFHVPEKRLPHAFGFCLFVMLPVFHGTEITKEMVQYGSEELFVPYSKHCDMMSVEPFSAVLHALYMYGPLILYVPPTSVNCIL